MVLKTKLRGAFPTTISLEHRFLGLVIGVLRSNTFGTRWVQQSRRVFIPEALLSAFTSQHTRGAQSQQLCQAPLSAAPPAFLEGQVLWEPRAKSRAVGWGENRTLSAAGHCLPEPYVVLISSRFCEHQRHSESAQKAHVKSSLPSCLCVGVAI